MELAREEAGRPVKGGPVAERAAPGELKDSAAERRRLEAEVLDLRAMAEERLMLIERIAHVEKDLENTSEIEGLRSRGFLGRLLNR